MHRCFVLFNPAEPIARFQPAVVVPIVTDAAHLAADSVPGSVNSDARPFLAPELMDDARGDADALAWLQPLTSPQRMYQS